MEMKDVTSNSDESSSEDDDENTILERILLNTQLLVWDEVTSW
jgi:hypothetical protein